MNPKPSRLGGFLAFVIPPKSHSHASMKDRECSGCPNPFWQSRPQQEAKAGVSQEAFADMCGLDRTYIGGVERGERNLSLINIEKIAQTFKLSLAELFRRV